jgi:hypothetical protein
VKSVAKNFPRSSFGAAPCHLIRGCLFCLLLGAGSAFAAADVKLVRVWPEWRDGKSFKRISEYFTGRENTGGQQNIRTDPARRTGYYFLVRLESPGAQRVQARLHLITLGSPEPRMTNFTADLRPGANVLNLGLTSPEWNDAKAIPVAWRLEVVSADDGAVLATEKSYLWDNPVAK